MEDELKIAAAGRSIPGALDNIRRYCGLRWSGGNDETWAWRYFDAVPTERDDQVEPVDVVCAASLHPGLSRADLGFFNDRRHDLAAWLRDTPRDDRLSDVDDSVVRHVENLVEAFPDVQISLLSKVLHRKRPHLVPILDRHIIDWYRPVTHRRAAADAWSPIVGAMRADQSDPELRLRLAIAESTIGTELWPHRTGDERARLSWLRMTDIAIWMHTR